MDRPIFIVGSARSGTTLLQRMMRSHSKIASPTGESHFFIPLYKNRASYGDLSSASNIKIVLEEMRRISREYVEEDLKGLSFDTDILAEEFRKENKSSIVEIISALMEKNAAGEGKQRWLEKTPYYVLHIKTILEMFPDAQFINIIRDGRDCALSMLQRKNDLKIFNIYHAATIWKQYVDTAQQAAEHLNNDQYFELRYEDLTNDSENKLREICVFINENFESSMVDFKKSKDPKSKTPMLSKPIQKTNTEKWREGMSKWDITIFESVAGSTLKNNNYPLTSTRKKSSKLIEAFYKIHQRYYYKQ